MADVQTPDQHRDFGSEPGTRGKPAGAVDPRAQEEHHGHVASDPDMTVAASEHALPRASKPVDTTPVRQRFAESRDR